MISILHRRNALAVVTVFVTAVLHGCSMEECSDKIKTGKCYIKCTGTVKVSPECSGEKAACESKFVNHGVTPGTGKVACAAADTVVSSTHTCATSTCGASSDQTTCCVAKSGGGGGGGAVACSTKFQVSTAGGDTMKCDAKKVVSAGNCTPPCAKATCCVDPVIAACTAHGDACKVETCAADTKIRVLGTGGCTTKCESQTGTDRESDVCGCSHGEETNANLVTLCLINQTCKGPSSTGSVGKCALPACASDADAGYLSNCLFDSTKHCKGGWFDGSSCIYENCEDTKYDSKKCACTSKTDENVKFLAGKEAKETVLKFCIFGSTCTISNGTTPTCSTKETCDNDTVENCEYTRKEGSKAFCLGANVYHADTNSCLPNCNTGPSEATTAATVAFLCGCHNPSNNAKTVCAVGPKTGDVLTKDKCQSNIGTTNPSACTSTT